MERVWCADVFVSPPWESLSFSTSSKCLVIDNVELTLQLLADKNQLDDVTEKIYQQVCNSQKEQGCTEIIRSYLEGNGNELGLPPIEANEAVILLYDATFSDINNKLQAKDLEKNELGDLVKQILQTFAAQLQANPVFHDSLNWIL